MKVDNLIIAARDRLPGNDLARWIVEIRGLGLDLARELLSLIGPVPDGVEDVAQLVAAGLSEEAAEARYKKAAKATVRDKMRWKLHDLQSKRR